MGKKSVKNGPDQAPMFVIKVAGSGKVIIDNIDIYNRGVESPYIPKRGLGSY